MTRYPRTSVQVKRPCVLLLVVGGVLVLSAVAGTIFGTPFEGLGGNCGDALDANGDQSFTCNTRGDLLLVFPVPAFLAGVGCLVSAYRLMHRRRSNPGPADRSPASAQ